MSDQPLRPAHLVHQVPEGDMKPAHFELPTQGDTWLDIQRYPDGSWALSLINEADHATYRYRLGRVQFRRLLRWMSWELRNSRKAATT